MKSLFFDPRKLCQLAVCGNYQRGWAFGGTHLSAIASSSLIIYQYQYHSVDKHQRGKIKKSSEKLVTVQIWGDIPWRAVTSSLLSQSLLTSTPLSFFLQTINCLAPLTFSISSVVRKLAYDRNISIKLKLETFTFHIISK